MSIAKELDKAYVKNDLDKLFSNVITMAFITGLEYESKIAKLKEYSDYMDSMNSYEDKPKKQTIHYDFKKEQKSKMGKIAHFSTSHKTCFKQCKYCYGNKIVNMYKASKANYENNTQMIIDRKGLPKLPKNCETVRISVNGDFSFPNVEDSYYYIQEWINLARQNPQIKFFGYTKSWQDKRLLPLLDKLRNLPNVVLRASIDRETGKNVPAGWVIAGIIQNHKKLPNKLWVKDEFSKDLKYFICNFAEDKKKCSTCRICFTSKLSHIAIFFPFH